MGAREPPGIVGDVASLASNGLRAIRTRLELVTIELQEERAWAMRFIVVAIGAVYLVSFGTLLAVLAASLALPEGMRAAFLGVFAGFMLAAGTGAIAWMQISARKRAPPFHDTIATLRRDEEGLEGAARE